MPAALNLTTLGADELLTWPVVGPNVNTIISVELVVTRRKSLEAKQYNPADFDIVLLKPKDDMENPFFQLPSSPIKEGETSRQAVCRALYECTGLTECKIVKISFPSNARRIPGMTCVSMLYFVSVDNKGSLKSSSGSGVPSFYKLSDVLKFGKNHLPFALDHRQMVTTAAGWLHQKFLTEQIHGLFKQASRAIIARIENPLHHAGYKNKLDEPVILYNSPYFESGILKPKNAMGRGSQRLARPSDQSVQGAVEVDVLLDDDVVYDRAHHSTRRAPNRPTLDPELPAVMEDDSSEEEEDKIEVTYSRPNKSRANTAKAPSITPPPLPPVQLAPTPPAPAPAPTPPAEDKPAPKPKRKMPRGLAANAIQAAWRGFAERRRLEQEKLKRESKRLSQQKLNETQLVSMFTPPEDLPSPTSPMDNLRPTSALTNRVSSAGSMLSMSSDEVGLALKHLKRDMANGMYDSPSPQPGSDVLGSPASSTEFGFGFGNEASPQSPQSPGSPNSPDSFIQVAPEDHPLADDLKADFTNPLFR
eukprot:m.144790 g.144790  ORF g.144790 m.144790 type:complete len:532 (+) comp14930_c0_seq9:352-1947(+)